MQVALRARLIGAGPIAAIVGTQVFWTIVPQGRGLPYLRLQVVSDPRPGHLKGFDAARQTRVQCDCFAPTYALARQLADLVVATAAPPATVDGVRFGHTGAAGPRDLGEDVEGFGYVHRASLDLFVTHGLKET